MAVNDNNAAVVYINTHDRPDCAPSDRWVRCLAGLVIVVSLSSAVVCLGVCMVTLQAVGDLESRLAQAESILAKDRETSTSLLAQVRESVELNNVEYSHKNRYKEIIDLYI
ncbi:hypothetical protein ElyMa_003246700 [Elysia marginata]|uniref:Uncharacterized protein n=1 Tax=Elysia marginata TaxID=1093978 RepID=A0AAV4J6U1_9GAST|nr:hypothetical protein ElyMa_003246700 [Elysia marginata]